MTRTVHINLIVKVEENDPEDAEKIRNWTAEEFVIEMAEHRTVKEFPWTVTSDEITG